MIAVIHNTENPGEQTTGKSLLLTWVKKEPAALNWDAVPLYLSRFESEGKGESETMTKMDAQTIRDQLEVVKANLDRNEDEKRVLLDLLKGYEGWLRLYGESSGASQPPLPIAKKVVDTTTKGTISMRAAIRQILREARGEPLHSKEIWRRAVEMGAKTAGENPLGLVDLSAFSLSKTEPIEKVGPRTWRWTGPEIVATSVTTSVSREALLAATRQ